MRTDEQIRSALHDLTNAPVPDDLAGRALSAAARRRRIRIGTSAGALVLVAAAAVTAGIQLTAAPGGSKPDPYTFSYQPAAGAVPVGGACVLLPVEPVTVKEVAPAMWPDFVRAAVDVLPARGDYVMQSGYSWCAWPGADKDAANAYAVVNLGHNREAGHLTISMYISATGVPSDCNGVNDIARTPAQHGLAPFPVLFCDEQTATAPLTFGFDVGTSVTVGAVYADGRAIIMESLVAEAGQPLAISAERLRTVIQDPQLHDVIPSTAAPGPGGDTPPEPVPSAS
jgi:hypothetical protein